MPFWFGKFLHTCYGAAFLLSLFNSSISVSAERYRTSIARSPSLESSPFAGLPPFDSELCNGWLRVGLPKKPITSDILPMAQRDGCISDWGLYIAPSGTDYAAPLDGCGLFRVGLVKKKVVIINYSAYAKKSAETRSENDLTYCSLDGGLLLSCMNRGMPIESGLSYETLPASRNSREVRRIRLFNKILGKSYIFGPFHIPGQRPALMSLPEGEGKLDLFCLPVDS